MVFELPELPGLRFPWFGRMKRELWRPLRQFVYERDKGQCCYCHEQAELFNCHCHHVLDLSLGGTNHPTNLKILCRKCHKKRHPHMLTPSESCGIGGVRLG